jgi:two-component system sensor histidine kinase and response regulator WspE
MSASDFSLMDLFREEVRSHAATLGQGLLQLESEPGNPQRIEPLMRAAHSIKGAARIVNIDPAVQLAHTLEDALVAAQEGRLRLESPDIDLLLKSTDVLASLAEVSDQSIAPWSASHEAGIAELKTLLRALTERPQQTPSPAVPPQDLTPAPPPRHALSIPAEPIVPGEDSSMLDLFREEVRVNAAILAQGLLELEGKTVDAQDVEPLREAAHSIRGAARIVSIEPAAQLAQAIEDALHLTQQEQVCLEPEQIKLFLRVLDVLAELIHVNEESVAPWIAQHQDEAAELQQQLKGTGVRGQESVIKSPAPVLSTQYSVLSTPHSAVKSQETALSVPTPDTALQTPEQESVVRVTAQSLNRLMGLAGESLIQARWLTPFSAALLKLKKLQDHLAGLLNNLTQALPDDLSEAVKEQVDAARGTITQCRQVLSERMSEFEDHAGQAEDLNSRLYREVILSRMRPFADGTHGFPRLVRDMARSLKKQVKLEIAGQNTEVDRDILEKLEAPLTHLLRNAIDHGIETPEERQTAAKAETGQVRLEARHRAGMLAITVADDGGGIDLDRLRHKVVERGLATAEMVQVMGEAELLEFLFLPGFSTATALTEFSGRGVGLDVVQDMVRKVGGTLRVTTRLGQGTSFHLQLPITLSVLRAVLVDIAGEPYAFPHNRIDRLLRVPRSEIHSLENRQFLSLGGQTIGLVVAAQILDLPAAVLNGDELPVLLLSDHSGQYGLIVETFRGEQDLVVRPLDRRLGKVPNVSAAAILDDGSPVLIADVEDLIRSMDQFIQSGSLKRCERSRTTAEQRKRILVVDDSITVREVERQLLRSRGYDVAVAIDGKDGWNLLQAEPFDLVVSDVDMPRMNGLDLVRAIRNDNALRNLPVVMVSYKERKEDRLQGLEVGANSYLTKSSFHDNTFLEAVVNLIGEA